MRNFVEICAGLPSASEAASRTCLGVWAELKSPLRASIHLLRGFACGIANKRRALPASAPVDLALGQSAIRPSRRSNRREFWCCLC